MKRTIIENKIRQKLAAEGLTLERGGRAERGVAFIADLGAKVITTGERAVRETRESVSRAAESAREAVHQATKPAPRRKKK